jgi:hypothetical protein
MPQIDWNSLMNNAAPKKRYAGANVKFFNSYNENKQKSLDAGRPIYDEIVSISIQWPGGDETVRRVEPQDIAEYPEKWAAFQAGNQPIESGTPLAEWPPLPGSTLRELQHLGFQTLEQLADANDEIKRRLGPTGRFVTMAKDWLESSNSSQAQVTALKQQLEREQRRTAKLEEQVELLMQRIEGNEGTDLRPRRISMPQEIEESEPFEDAVSEEDAPRRRGRPRKV